MKKQGVTIILCLFVALFLVACGETESAKTIEKAQKESLSGNPQKAVELLLIAITEDPTNIQAYYELANEYTALGEPEKAAMYYKKALELDDAAKAKAPDSNNQDPVKPVAPIPDGNPNVVYPDGNTPYGGDGFVADENTITYMVGNIFEGYLFEGQEVVGLSIESAMSLLESKYPYITMDETFGTSITGSADDGSGFTAVDDGYGNKSLNVYTAEGGGISVMDASNYGGGVQFLGVYNYPAGGKFNTNIGKNMKDVLDDMAPDLYDAVMSTAPDGMIHQWNNIQIMKFSETGFQIMQGNIGYIIFNTDLSGTVRDITLTLN